MDTSNLSINQLNYLYRHGDSQLKALVTARLSSIQRSHVNTRQDRVLKETEKIAARLAEVAPGLTADQYKLLAQYVLERADDRWYDGYNQGYAKGKEER